MWKLVEKTEIWVPITGIDDADEYINYLFVYARVQRQDMDAHVGIPFWDTYPVAVRRIEESPQRLSCPWTIVI